MTDSEAIKEYAEHEREDAFKFLVERHASLVYSAVLRVLKNSGVISDAARSSSL